MPDGRRRPPGPRKGWELEAAALAKDHGPLVSAMELQLRRQDPAGLFDAGEALLRAAGHLPIAWSCYTAALAEMGAAPALREAVHRRWVQAHPDHLPAWAELILLLLHPRTLDKAQRALDELLARSSGHAVLDELEALGVPLRRDRPPARPPAAARTRRATAPARERTSPARKGGAGGKGPGGGGARAARGKSTPAKEAGGRRPAPVPAPLPAAPPPPVPVHLLQGEGLEPLLRRLLTGPHDAAEDVVLARRGAELLAEDHFDRLLCLEALTGVDRLGYQLETALKVLKRFHGRVLLADEVGLGKTIEACLVLKEYLLRGLVQRALILVPPALVGQWQGELADKFGISSTSTQDDSFRSDPAGFWEGGPVLVGSLALARTSPHRERVLAQHYDLIVVDEAHHIKNRTTKGWQLVNSLRSRFFLMLTATPVETDLDELYNLVTLLRPGTLGTDAEFRRRFVRAGDPTRPRDPETLRQLLQEVMVRNTRAVCGVQLPPRVVRTLVVHPLPEEAQLYLRLLEQARRLGRGPAGTLVRLLLEEAGSSPAAAAATADKVLAERGASLDPELRACLAELGRLASRLPLTAKLETLGRLLPGGKLLVFSRFTATLEQIAVFLRRLDVPHERFSGEMSAAHKDQAVAAFCSPGGPDVLLCSEVGGEGRNLQVCHRLVNFDIPWNPMKIEQRIGRIHRIGQTETVEVVNLASAGSAEERILDVLDRRVNLFELVVGEMDLILGELSEERDFADRIYEIYAGSGDEADVQAGFDRLAEELLAARGRLARIKALDEVLFGREYQA